VMNARVEEEAMVDVELGGFMMSGGAMSGGERSDPERRDPPRSAVEVVSREGIERPDPEVPAKAQRRRFSAQYKKKLLKEADACKGRHGAMGALLRREGLFSSYRNSWIGLKRSSHSKKNSRRCWGSPWIRRKTTRHADDSD